MQPRSLTFLIIVLVLTGLSAWVVVGAQRPDAMLKPAYGLDIQGGSRFIFRLKTEELKDFDRSRLQSVQNDMVRILSGRASGALGVSEPVVTAKGTDQIVVELPGYANVEEAREVISNTAKVMVYWADNVSTRIRERRYVEAGKKEIGEVEYVTFSRTFDPDTVLAPGDKAYEDMIADWEVILEGSDVADAGLIVSGNKTQPEFRFSDAGSKKLEAWSRRHLNKGENIAFVLDNRVLNIAPVKEGAILSDSAFIDGDFPVKYVKTLTELVKAGSLPVPLEELSRQSVDPTIGKQALGDMLRAGAICLGLICLFMVVYYRLPGVLSALAMVLYALLTFATLLALKATLSLAAVAAFILSVGMAIDANILVFERIKEEIRAGRAIPLAVQAGFRRALAAIVDSNACTVITCLVLLALGDGPVKGFATTLILGVLVSFVTAFLVTRTLLELALMFGLGKKESAFAVNTNWFGGGKEEEAVSKAWPIISRMKTWFAISALLIAVGVPAVLTNGLKYNVEFMGGVEGRYSVPQGMTAAQIRDNLESKGYRGFNLKFAETEAGKTVYITVPDKDLTNEKLAADAGLPLEKSDFYAIGPAVRKETVSKAITSIVISCGLIMLFLAIRFGVAVGGVANGLRFGLSAVAALFHDVLFVLGAAAIVGHLLGWEVSGLFVTAMLTVIGFSVHDTIIIFDRVRENLRKLGTSLSFEQLCDVSVTQSVSRSINTSLSAIVPLGVLIAFGTPTPELKFMCLTMLLGIGIGAYSSIFNAVPILYLWDRAVQRKHGAEAGLLTQAQAQAKATAALRLQTAAAPGGADTAGYGQIKRRSSVVDQASKPLDD